MSQHSFRIVVFFGWAAWAAVAPGVGQGVVGEDPPPATAQRSAAAAAGVYQERLAPRWSEDDRWLWYRRNLPAGRHEFVLVESASGEKRLGFDHARLATALAEKLGQTVDAERLPIEMVEFVENASVVVFRHGDKDYRCPLADYVLVEASQRREGTSLSGSRSDGASEMDLEIVNETERNLELVWLESRGAGRSYGVVAAGQRRRQHTFRGHRWELRDDKGAVYARFAADPESPRVVVERDAAPLPERRPRGPGRPGGDEQPRRSPDGQWEAVVRDHNLFLRRTASDEETQLTQDGVEDCFYDMPQWSPDSRTLAAFRIRPGERLEVHLVESSPEDGGRARLHSRPYALPGDRFTSYQLCLFDAAESRAIPCNTDVLDFGRPRLRWRKNGGKLTYEQVDRGHQRFRLIEVDARTGEHRNVIDEISETFIWTAHAEAIGMPLVNWLNDDELIYSSERSGWRSLYLVQADTGVMSPIVAGDFVVRGVDRVDLENREIWFRACGKHPDQDPYHVHFYRVGLDGQGWIALTAGDGDHSLEYSPQGGYYIDTYSRADAPPIHELRRASDGELVVELERADISEWLEAGHRLPQRFVAKGRDGATDIWGLIHAPDNAAPGAKHPVLEYIYAGPHDAHVPKRFSSRRRFRDLTELGFFVVQIDGMGTAHRGKAFHDVCWKNLKDAGFPDRIAWIQAAAAENPALDITRVGVFGTSAGGQNAAGAVLFHPDFYQAAVANCGCHDNRLDKASWNEQWMGYPVDEAYSQCSNIDNAERLQGDLFLVVGEMDSNVPPESTYRFVDALIEAGKDFDLLVVPGGGHGAGGAYGQRRLRDFFAASLLDEASASRRPDVSASASAEAGPAPPDAKEPLLPPLDARDRPAIRLENRFRADLNNLVRFYPSTVFPLASERLDKFYLDWIIELQSLEAAQQLEDDDRRDLAELREEITRSRLELNVQARRLRDLRPLLPFAGIVEELVAGKLQVQPVDGRQAAAQVDEVRRLAEELADQQREETRALLQSYSAESRSQAAEAVGQLRRSLAQWHAFFDGYDPQFSWWLREPHRAAEESLEKYQQTLQKVAAGDGESPAAAAGAVQAVAAARVLRDSDVPALDPLWAADPGRMQAVIARYEREFARRGRRRRDEAPPEQRREKLREFQSALKDLPFGEFTVDERIDYLLLKNHIAGELFRIQESSGDQERQVMDSSGIPGRPIGEEALAKLLQLEMIPYSAEELIDMAGQEYQWCLAEMKRAAAEMGYGDDWRRAVEAVKDMHVEPGRQPFVIRDLAHEAIDYLIEHDLVSVPPLAAETWGMRMMSPDRQRINPFFTGGADITVSFPTDAMTHDEKLQSLRGNNIPFARATVHHELIPGHNLQDFIYRRNRPYRRLFGTPFWGEGWALYWEMRLYQREFPPTAADRLGFLVWRSHRCARIVFSLSFHLGRMTPLECVDYLVANVGFERKNAEAEVRRSFATNYGPLYQAAYMVGGLQFRALHRELVEQGDMTEKAFHDAVLRENSMPVELVRAALLREPLKRNHQPSWRFYQAP